MKPMVSEPGIAVSSPINSRARQLEEGGGSYHEWTIEEVLEWLTQVGGTRSLAVHVYPSIHSTRTTQSKIIYKAVHAAFKEHHVDGEVLFYLTEDQVRDYPLDGRSGA